jgi:hypothetical protein
VCLELWIDFFFKKGIVIYLNGIFIALMEGKIPSFLARIEMTSGISFKKIKF